MYCRHCGRELPENVNFCPACGTKVVPIQLPAEAPLTAPRPEPAKEVPSFSVGDLGEEFLRFIDRHVQAATGFETAAQLLNSKVSIAFYGKCFLFPVLGIWIVTWLLMWMNDRGFLRGLLAGALLGALLGLIIGFFTAYVVGWYRRGKVSTRYTSVFSDPLDLADLQEFLSESLPKISPMFQQWSPMTQVGYGFRGVLTAEMTNAMQRAAHEVTIGTELGPKNKFFAELTIYPDQQDPTSGKVWYVPGVEHRIVGIFSFKKYTLLVQIAPILQAAVTYYLELKRQGSPQEP